MKSILLMLVLSVCLFANQNTCDYLEKIYKGRAYKLDINRAYLHSWVVVDSIGVVWHIKTDPHANCHIKYKTRLIDKIKKD